MSVSRKTAQVWRLTNYLIESVRAKALAEAQAAKAETQIAKAQLEVLAAKAESQIAKAEAEVRAAKAESQISKAQAEVRAAKALEEVRAAKAEAEIRAAKALEEVRAAKAEAEIRAVKAQGDAQTAKVELEKKNLLCSIQQAALLRLRGRLNMRGLLETLEEEVEDRHPELKGKNRTETFKNALEHDLYKSLLCCIQTQGNVRDAKKAADFLSMIYASLSRKIHNSKTAVEYQVSDDQVDIDVHALSLQEARALACVAEHLNMPYRIVHEPRVDSSVDQ